MLLLLAIAGCVSAEPVVALLGATLEPCAIAGLSAESLCGTVRVPEDPDAPSGRAIDLRVLVLPALRTTPEPDPVFFLAGGPGQAASAVAAQVYPALAAVQRDRDIVFIDQRGTGASNPLRCSPADDLTLDESLRGDVDGGLLTDCRDGYDANLRFYTTPYAMDDLDTVRDTLGYARINLIGGSYGTRAAQVYLRRHEAQVRSVVLDGVVPLDVPLFLGFAPDAEASLAAAFRDCAAEPACAARFGDLRVGFRALLADLSEPRPFAMTHPRTGAVEEIPVDRSTVAAAVRNLLYVPALTSVLPLDLNRAASGDFAPLMAQSLTVSGGSSDTIATGMMLSVVCAEDVQRLEEAAVAEAAEGTFLGTDIVDAMREACTDWPLGGLPDGYSAPVRSEVPVLALSGALNPVTPPRHAEAVLASLPAGRHVVAPGVAHGVLSVGCTPRVVAAFLEAGSAEGLDVGCIESIVRPPFFVDFAGPAP